mgnify:CR=1 FL=1
MINGVIFDMDGLMFDTERMWATFWEPALAALGLEYKEGLAEAERGTAGETSRNIVRQFYGEDCDANAIIDSLHRVADEEFQKPVPKKPGLDELLAWLDANHIPMAVASSSRVHVIEGNLNNWGLTHYPASRSSTPSPTRRSSCWRRKSWAPTPPTRWCWRTATTVSAPVPPGALSPSWCPICSPPTMRCAACIPWNAPA